MKTKTAFSVAFFLLVLAAASLTSQAQSQLIWSVGLDDNGWPAGAGGGTNTSFVQENGVINDLPGSPASTSTPQGADNDYYFAGVYTNVIASVTNFYGDYTPVGLVSTNEEAAERAFAAADNDLRYHFNLPSSLKTNDVLTVSFDALNLDDPSDVNTDPRYGIEVYFNGLLVQSQIVIHTNQLDISYTTAQFSLASVNAQVGPGFDNIVSLKGTNYNAEGGGNWMGIDFVQLNTVTNTNPPPPALVWAVGRDDDGWPAGTGGGTNTSFVQENGAINDLPGSPASTTAPQGADNDYYFAGIYTNVIASVTNFYGGYTPVGLVSTNEEAAERAFAAADNDLRYHFNLASSLKTNDLLTVSFDANNLDDPSDVNTDPRYGVEVYFNGVLVQPQILVRPVDLDTDYTTPRFTLASVNAAVGPGFDNIVSLRGVNYNAEGGGNWMGIDYVQLNSASATVIVTNPPLAQVNVPGNLAVGPSVTGTGGGNLKGEYWKRPINTIHTDGATNPTNAIDTQIDGFGTPTGTFLAKKFVYLGNDLTPIKNWLTNDTASFVGTATNLDDGAIRFSGFINVTNAGVIKLGTTSDDGSRITIAGIDVINNDGGHGDATMDTNVNFSAAGLYPIEITYFNGDWTSDGTGTNLNHSGSTDPTLHGGANFHLRVAGADVTTAGAAMFRSTTPFIIVPTNLAVSAAVTGAGGGNLKGEYWKRPINTIPTDGATNPTNRIDAVIDGFGTPTGTFQAKKFVYLGNDLTPIKNWLTNDNASFVGTATNLDDGAFRFTGFINVTNAGIVSLGTTSDDGSRITIGGIDVINNDGGHGDATMDTNVNFSAAGLYPIEITYFNGDWTSDGTGTNLNHSGSTDPTLHGGANFHLRVAGADVTTAGAAMFRSTTPFIIVPTNLAVSAAVTGAGGGNLKGEYWKRPINTIRTDGATNPTNRIDAQIEGFGTPTGTFQAKKFVYLGNDLTPIKNWLTNDAPSFVGTATNLDDGAFRFTGFLNVTNAGTISLGTTSDDGSRITIGGIDVINNDGGHGDATMDTNVNFSAAGLYPIEITYFNGDWTSDGTGTNLNHSGSTDPTLHGGANFHLRVAGADVTTAGAAMFRSTTPFIIVPTNLAVSAAVTGAGGGNLKGEYWKRPINTIRTDGATNPTNRIDAQIEGFGTPTGTFQAKKFVYLGNDLTPIKNWLTNDNASFVGTATNLDDGAFRFTGFLNVTNAGTISLGTTSDDGSRITIGGIDVINNDGGHGDATMDTNVNFSAAGLYPIEITYFNGDWTSDGTGTNLNHSGSTDPTLHGGANFHLRVAGADVTTAGAAMFRSTTPFIIVPTNLAVSAAVTGAGGGSLKGEYWKRPPVSIPTDGATNPTNRIDALIEGFGPADATFHATKLVYLGNDLTPIKNWLTNDNASFVGDTNNLDDGAVRFSGYINVTNAGTISLGTTSDDGSRITIGGIDVINNDGGHGDATMDTNVNFSAAGLYPIEITYWNGDWTSDGTGTNLNHSGSTDPTLHGGANFHLRVSGADVTTALAAMFHPALITWVVETGGDNEATDTISAKWTGQTIPVSVADEPVPGLVVGENYSVGFFGNHAPAYVDRAHRYNHASNTVLIPDYLFGGEYIMNGNDNRDNATMTMDVTVSQAVQVYLLIDNRLGDTNNANPPAFDATHMQWVLDQGWTAVTTGINRTGSATDPDEVGIDESADGTIDNWFSVYTKAFPAGTFQLKQADNTGQNMYGVVVTPAVGTPSAPSLGISLQGTNLVITVPAGYRLQRTASLSAPVTWTDVPGTSPYTVPLSGAQGYYRGVSP